MKKIQFFIDDQAYEILEKLSRRGDKPRFIEQAIKQAFNSNLAQIFPWKENISCSSKLISANDLMPSSINYDKEFS